MTDNNIDNQSTEKEKLSDKEKVEIANFGQCCSFLKSRTDME